MIYVVAKDYKDYQNYVTNNNLDYISCEYVPSAIDFGKSKFNFKTDRVVLLPKWKENKKFIGLEKELYLAGVDLNNIN